MIQTPDTVETIKLYYQSITLSLKISHINFGLMPLKYNIKQIGPNKQVRGYYLGQVI